MGLLGSTMLGNQGTHDYFIYVFKLRGDTKLNAL